jgi:iron complex outermembrane receptor protein
VIIRTIIPKGEIMTNSTKYSSTLRQFMAASSLVALASMAAPVAAQTAPVTDVSAESAGEGNVIVVTARRKEEALQDVPLSISAMTGEQLQDAGVRNARDIAYLTPGVTINSGGAEFSTQPIIRGVVGLGGSSGVVSFLDAVPLPSASSINVSMLDLERVEIVKGPVAALYGQNAYSGVINYVTKVPGNDFGAEFEGTVARGDFYSLKGLVTLPVVSDILSFSIAGNYEDFGGIYKDAVNGNKAGGYEKRDVRLSAHFTPTDRLTINGSLYYGRDKFDVTPLVYATNNCGPQSTNPVTAGEFTVYCGALNFNPVEIASVPDSTEIAGNDREVWFGNVRMNYDLDYGDIGLLFGYQDSQERRFNDFTGDRDGIPFQLTDGSVANLLEYFGSDSNSKGWNAELRFNSPSDMPFRYSLGGYYSKDDGLTSTIISLDGANIPDGLTVANAFAADFVTFDGTPSSKRITINETDNESYSGFVSADLDLFDGLTVSGEYRRSHYSTTTDQVRSTSFPDTVRPLGDPYKFTYDTDSYRFSAKYKFASNIMGYVSYGQGVKPGGANTRATIASERTYESETNKSYELGVKSSFMNNRIQMNAALFRVDSTNFQILGPSDDPLNSGLVTKNFGGARTQGVEFDMNFAPVSGFAVNLGVAYVDPKFSEGTLDFSTASLCLAVAACDNDRVVSVVTASGGTRDALNLAGLQVPRTSKLTANLGVAFDGYLTDSVSWFSRVDTRFEDKQYAQSDNLAWYDERFQVNLRAGIETELFRITAFIDNVTNNQTPEQVLKLTRLNDFNGNLSGYLPMPRTYGLTIAVSY